MLAYNLTTPPPVAAMFLRAPVRMPSPRALVEAEASRLIDVLDAMEPDADIEQDAGEEAEGSWPYGTTDDDEDGGDDEPSLAGSDTDRELDTSDFEPSLGSLGGTSNSILLTGYRMGARRHRCEIWAGGARDERELDDGDAPEIDHDFEAVNEDGGDIQDAPHE